MTKIPDRTSSVQGAYLDWMVQTSVVLDIWMDNGTHLVGVVLDHDVTTIWLTSPTGKKQRLVYKAEISTMRPKEQPAGTIERRILRKRRHRYRPLENFKHPVPEPENS